MIVCLGSSSLPIGLRERLCEDMAPLASTVALKPVSLCSKVALGGTQVGTSFLCPTPGQNLSLGFEAALKQLSQLLSTIPSLLSCLILLLGSA